MKKNYFTDVFCTYCAAGVRCELGSHVTHSLNKYGEPLVRKSFVIVTFWYHNFSKSVYRYSSFDKAKSTYLAMITSLIESNNDFLSYTK